MSERSLGGHQVAVSIPDRLEPTVPAPSEGAQGPPISEPLPGSWLELQRKLDELGRGLALHNRPDTVAGPFGGSLDSDGNGYIGIYQAADGMEARLHRLVVNTLVLATGARYTPAAPYAASSAYLEILTAAQPQLDSVGNDGLLDFAPPVAGGPIFPGLFTDNSMQASFVRGPNWFVLHVNGGPALGFVFGRYQIRLERQRGIV